MGLSRTLELSFKWLSRACGRSCAPGGNVLLLGLPCGVLAGSMKLFLTGVDGRPRSSLLLFSLAPGEKMFDMKLAIVVLLSLSRDGVAGD